MRRTKWSNEDMLRRLFPLTFVVVACALFAILSWPLALLGLAGLNVVVCVGFWISGKRFGACLAGVTAALIIAMLFFTDWGLSSPKPVVRVAWSYLIAACASELALFVYWILGVEIKGCCSDPPIDSHKQGARESDLTR